MSTADWARVSELFEQAIERPSEAREGWVRAACTDAAVVTEVLGLLSAYEAEPGFLESPVDAAAAARAIERGAAGTPTERHVGPYRIVREIGRGGMGVVYEAEDTRFERRVALKLLPGIWSATVLAERFQFERRVLASLNHPNIARLLDGGTTDEGLSYFVMELVEGERIDAWCDRHALDMRARVRLLIPVCEAVAHVHQHLVVHRDLKPANILITADGQPKLLDFGIATLVSEDTGASAGLTRTGQSSFTPEYASPEQVRGEPVTTATDVYSLGVLAYRLLSGHPPYSLQLSQGLSPVTPAEAARIICDEDPPPPSRVADASAAKALRGDLDTILLKALRKDPRERYASVFGLSSDLAAWLDGRETSATPATLGYRIRKFSARHRPAIAAAAAILLTLVGGAATTAWQARLARQERDKAENRFRDVREFSRSLLFEVHDSLRTLPGATEPRRLLLARAVQFLDRLASDASNDDPLKLELAEGYRRLGQVQGSALSENLGDVAGAAASFEKAVTLAEDVLSRRPTWLEAANVATGAYDDLASTLLQRGQVDDAESAYERHRALVAQMERRYPTDPAGRASIAASYVNLGLFRATRRDLTGARALYEQAIAIFEALPTERRSRDEVMRSHAFALKRLGAILLAEGQVDAGERRYLEALALDEAMVARHPDDARYRYDMTFSLSDLGLAASRRGNAEAATAFWTRALEIREAAVAADPKDIRAMQGVANLRANLGNTARQLERFEDAVANWRAVLRMRDTLLAQQGPVPQALMNHAEARTVLAGCLIDLAGTTGGPRRQALVSEARALLTAAAAEAEPLAANHQTARAIIGQIALDRARLTRF
jgi:non-specific serine/threonine protein kinase/serine/threonine-protein kinase